MFQFFLHHFICQLNIFKKAVHVNYVGQLFVYKFFTTFVLSLILLTFLTNNAFAMSFFNKNKLPSTPYALPIDISKKGNKAEIDLYIKSDEERKRLEPKTVAFELTFIPYDPRQDKNSKYYEGFWRRNLQDIAMFRKYFREYTKEEKSEIWKEDERLTKLLGGGFTVDDGSEYGRHFDYPPPIPIPNIRITITDLNDPNKKVVYDEVLEVKKHPRKGGYFIKFLGYIKLVSSNYKIIAEVQSNAYEFVGTKVILKIGYYRAKF